MGRLTFEGKFCDIAMCRENPCPYNGSCSQREVWERLKAYEDAEEQGRLTVLPCKVGDYVWAISQRNRGKEATQGRVSQMFYMDGMELCVVVYHVCRGIWGKNVFATKEEAEAALGGVRKDGEPSESRKRENR